MKFDAAFKRRLRVYLIGVGLGCILAWALVIRKRSNEMNRYMSWTPNGRVLLEIREDNNLILPDNFWCEMECQGFTSEDLRLLKEEGDVDFKASQTKGEHKTYVIRLNQEDDRVLRIDFEFEGDSHTAGLPVNEANPKTCDC